MGRKRHIIWVAGLLGLTFAISARGAEPPELTKQQIERLESVWLYLANCGHFVVNGSAVDQEGNPVPSFSVEHPRGFTTEEWTKIEAAMIAEDTKELEAFDKKINAEGPRITQGKSGKFQIDVKNTDIYSFPLRFTAKGYYDAKVDLEMAVSKKEVNSINQAILSGVVPKEVSVKRTLRVVMRKKGRGNVKLERWFMDLNVTTKGERTGYQFAPQAGKGKAGPVRLGNLKDQLPPRSVFLSVGTNKDRGFAVKDLSQPWEDSRFHIVVPTEAKLVMNSAAGDGFIRYTPKLQESADESIHYVLEPIRRGMGTAPEKGYQPEVPLSTDDILTSHHTDKDLMYYVKIGGRYGRARYLSYFFNENRTEFRIRLAIEMQPDGSRNLETEE